MKVEVTDANRAALADLYRRESDKLADLRQEAEDLLSEGQMLYRERVLRKAELQNQRLIGIRLAAELFGVDLDASASGTAKKSGKAQGSASGKSGKASGKKGA